MYNEIVKEMLSKVNMKDAISCENQKKYSISDNFSTIEIYIRDATVSYRVQGDAYIIAMTKWLQLELINNESLENIVLEDLVNIFDLPDIKLRNAIQIIELIEKINEI